MSTLDDENDTELTIYNTLTHDHYCPWEYGFCILYGNKTIQHNGLDNVTDKDIENLEYFVNLLKAIKYKNDNKSIS